MDRKCTKRVAYIHSTWIQLPFILHLLVGCLGDIETKSYPKPNFILTKILIFKKLQSLDFISLCTIKDIYEIINYFQQITYYSC